MVLHACLDGFVEAYSLRARGHAGFCRNCNIADLIFVLRHLTDRARARNQPLHCCFVEFENAYSSIPCDALMRHLAYVGVAGDMLRTLVEMYWDVRMRPKQGAVLGPAFESTCGVRQGDPLPPSFLGFIWTRWGPF
jgi:hypothetical protein